MIETAFLRRPRSGANLQIFLVSAITSLLVVRLFLHLAGYPQLGGGRFHVAHMLFGGLFMLAAIVILLGYAGRRANRTAAAIGGIGFGVFIDELGKFITKDNNYFYEPTVGLIYIVFVTLFLTIHAIGRRQDYTSREYLLAALDQLEEVVRHDFDAVERDRTLALLSRADPSDPLTQPLIRLTRRVPVEQPSQRGPLRRTLYRWRNAYARLIGRRRTRRLIELFFVGDAIYLVAGVVRRINVDALFDAHQYIALAQVVSSLAAACFVVYGIIAWRVSRLKAYESFHRALIITLFITEFFAFYQEQFEALPGFFVNLGALIALGYAKTEERRLAQSATTTKNRHFFKKGGWWFGN